MLLDICSLVFTGGSCVCEEAALLQGLPWIASLVIVGLREPDQRGKQAAHLPGWCLRQMRARSLGKEGRR